MKKNQYGVPWVLTALFAAAVGCGGVDDGELASTIEEGQVETTASALGTNCRELCRRYESLEQYNINRHLVGRTIPDPIVAGIEDAADHLTQAGQASANSQESLCWMGNVSVASVWSTVQPQYDIDRDLSAQQAQQRINDCEAQFGL
ncbi:MAG: hypothetical protein AAFN74_20180 [Myxococcota bacterium]